MNVRSFSSKLIAIVILASCSITMSCKDDDNGPNCNQTYQKIATATETAFTSTSCSARLDAFNELIKLYRAGKNCPELKQEIEDAGYDNVEDFITEIEEIRDEDQADC